MNTKAATKAAISAANIPLSDRDESLLLMEPMRLSHVPVSQNWSTSPAAFGPLRVDLPETSAPIKTTWCNATCPEAVMWAGAASSVKKP